MKFLKILYFLGIFICITCKFSNKDKKAETPKNINHNIDNSNLQNPQKIVLTNDKIKKIENKITNNKMLTRLDFILLDSFIKNNNDESKFEELGYILFNYLNKNKKNNLLFLSYLKIYDNKYQEEFVHSLIKLMCIDIGDANYTYQKFITDFELFKDYVITEKSIFDCLSNNIQ